jgi:hypothetical protein
MNSINAIFVSLLIFSACQCAPKESLSEPISEIVKAHKTSKWVLDVAGLPVSSRDPAIDHSDLEAYVLESPKGVADHYGYTVLYSRSKMQYWIIREGGYSGAVTFFGPCDYKPKPRRIGAN